MDSDAKYLKRKVKAGTLDVHPTEKALVVNYELEATILGELGDPMLGDRKECQKIIRLKSLNSGTDIAALTNEIINKCKLIHPSKVPEVEQLLYYLQNRKEKELNCGEDGAIGVSEDSPSNVRIQSASSHHRYSPVETLNKGEVGNINNLEDYIELLYEELPSKIRGSGLILQLARNPDNLDELSQNETLLGALSRVLREDWKMSIDLSTNIIYVFFCFSTFSQFHRVIGRHKVGSLVVDIVEYEIERHTTTCSGKKENDDEELSSKNEKRFNGFVAKQEQALRVSIYLLLNLAENVNVEEKMKRKGMVKMLVSLLERRNVELLILVVSFLKKMSSYASSKEEMKRNKIMDKLAPLLNRYDNDDADAKDLTNATVRLLLNLSFDKELRRQMVETGMLPKLVLLMADPRHQNPVCCVLYHHSMDDKGKSVFTYTDCIPIIMRMILESEEEKVDLEVMALGINLAANKRNAQLICEGHGLRMLMRRAFHHQDALVMKMMRNISQHDGLTKNLFIEFIGDVADAVQRADSDEFVVECLGILGNLTIPDLDFERILKEYDLLPWMKQKLVPANQKRGEEDDLVLEVVIFLGTCVADPFAAQYVCESNTTECLIDLLKAKQEDDEIVLQVVYVFHQLCIHEETRKCVIRDSDAVAYIIDLMHDKNSEVQKVCDRTLDAISQRDDSWCERVKREKFKFHNAQWLEIVQSLKSNDGDGYGPVAYGSGEVEESDVVLGPHRDTDAADDDDNEFERRIRSSEGLL